MNISDLNTYDWREAFAYAGEPSGNGSPRLERATPSTTASLEPFGIAAVKEVLAAIEGENDGPPWRIAGLLHDGRWFYLEAGCDYTGWDCRAGGQTSIADTREDLIRFGLTDEAREILGLHIVREFDEGEGL